MAECHSYQSSIIDHTTIQKFQKAAIKCQEISSLSRMDFKFEQIFSISRTSRHPEFKVYFLTEEKTFGTDICILTYPLILQHCNLCRLQ